jgi:hypothetical protein
VSNRPHLKLFIFRHVSTICSYFEMRVVKTALDEGYSTQLRRTNLCNNSVRSQSRKRIKQDLLQPWSNSCRSLCPYGLTPRSEATWLLGSRVWIPLGTWTLVSCIGCVLYTQSNKNPSVKIFQVPEPVVTCGPAAIIIRVISLSPYLRIRAVSVYHIHFNQSHTTYINRRQQFILSKCIVVFG